MYAIGISAQFEAAHKLTGDFGPATRMHGHTYRLEVVVRGAELSEDGVLYDIGKLRPMVDELAASLHYRDLADVPGLQGKNSTAEAVAAYCWEKLASQLHASNLHSLLVRIWESPQVYAERDDLLESC